VALAAALGGTMAPAALDRAEAKTAADCPWVGSTDPIPDRVNQVMAVLTEDQKLQILHGNNNASPYIGNITGIPEICLPDIGLEDGPHGVGDGLDGATQMPSGNTSGSTFDPDLEQQYGSAIGAEFAGKGAQIALGPTVNIVRDPRWGRSFESFGEDPYLNGVMATADVKGLQSQGVMASVKHAAAYNIEHPAGSVTVDERTLQEIYLPAFQMAVEDAAPGTIMCGYSTVNTVPACQSPQVLQQPLYDQTGPSAFGGFVLSDWGGTHSTEDSVKAGLSMEMPNGYFYADLLKQALAAGTVTEDQLDTMVRRVLTQFFTFGIFDKTPSGSTGAVVTTPDHVAVARKGAEEGIVMLKNDGLLPLSTDTTKSIAVLGVDGGAGVQSIGGGSATVRSSDTVWPITGLQNRVQGTGTTVTYNDGTDVGAATDLARDSDVAIVFASDNYGNEEHDSADLDLPDNQNDLIAQVAAANPRTIVVLDDNSAINMPWLNDVAGVFEAFYPGQQIGTAVAELLFGDVNPSGKLPVTFPKSLADVPAHTTAQWPGENDEIQYSEKLDVGYRWYDAQNIEPLFPFGYGLSYTTFGYGNLSVGAWNGSSAQVTATVTNTGQRTGTDVAQLYVSHPAAAGEPPRQLRGFQRVTLDPGQSKTVTFTLSARDLSHWDTDAGDWATTAGTYQVSVGDSSRDLPLTGDLPLTAAASRKATALAATGTQTADGTLGMAAAVGMSSPRDKALTWTYPKAGKEVTYRAQGLPPGLTMDGHGTVTGAGTRRGTYTVTVTAHDTKGRHGTATFLWTVT
jgi:beta-glucosidase